MRKFLILSAFLLVLTGCETTGDCLYQVRKSYCKPYGWLTEYDCSAVNNKAYDEAVKACIEAHK